MKKIAVIGAAGYVGQYVIDRLIATGLDPVAITHANGKIILARKGIAILEPDQIHMAGKFDFVVNLAYSRSYDRKQNRKQQQELIRLISSLNNKGTTIIHLSTLAVFGYALEHPQHLQPVSNRKDYLYISSKIETENLLLAAFPDNPLHIVRIGNVWGPAAPAWVINLAEAITGGEPVLFHPAAFSNITDVFHVADYIHFLINRQSNFQFHHLAEFSHLPWEFFLRKIADETGRELVPFSEVRFYPKNVQEEFIHLIALNPVQALRQASKSRFFSGPASALIQMIPKSIKKYVKPKLPLSSNHIDLLSSWILSAQTQFEQMADPQWSPTLSPDKSVALVQQWLFEAGFSHPHSSK